MNINARLKEIQAERQALQDRKAKMIKFINILHSELNNYRLSNNIHQQQYE